MEWVAIIITLIGAAASVWGAMVSRASAAQSSEHEDAARDAVKQVRDATKSNDSAVELKQAQQSLDEMEALLHNIRGAGSNKAIEKSRIENVVVQLRQKMSKTCIHIRDSNVVSSDVSGIKNKCDVHIDQLESASTAKEQANWAREIIDDIQGLGAIVQPHLQTQIDKFETAISPVDS